MNRTLCRPCRNQARCRQCAECRFPAAPSSLPSITIHTWESGRTQKASWGLADLQQHRAASLTGAGNNTTQRERIACTKGDLRIEEEKGEEEEDEEDNFHVTVARDEKCRVRTSAGGGGKGGDTQPPANKTRGEKKKEKETKKKKRKETSPLLLVPGGDTNSSTVGEPARFNHFEILFHLS